MGYPDSVILMLYVHNSAQINRVWFDDVAIGETYIGPIPATSGVEMK